jgi:serine protease Do
MPSQASQEQWGLQLQDIPPHLAARRGLQTDHGALVVGVQPDSPAAEAGMRAGDIILEVNRQAVASLEDARAAFARAADQDAILLLVQRRDSSLYIPLEKQA